MTDRVPIHDGRKPEVCDRCRSPYPAVMRGMQLVHEKPDGSRTSCVKLDAEILAAVDRDRAAAKHFAETGPCQICVELGRNGIDVPCSVCDSQAAAVAPQGEPLPVRSATTTAAARRDYHAGASSRVPRSLGVRP